MDGGGTGCGGIVHVLLVVQVVLNSGLIHYSDMHI